MIASKIHIFRLTRAVGLYRRQLILFVSALAFALVAPTNAATGPRLYVFASADMRAHTFEKDLESELPGVDVTVFSRIREFEQALLDRPDGALARSPVLQSYGLKADLQGLVGSSATERFVLMSTNTPITINDLQGKMLGAVDILGRKKMDEFVTKILGIPAPKLKHVTHERDLLALLQFDTVAAVLISESWAKLLQSKSEMQLKITPLINEVGLVGISFSSPQARSALEPKVKAASLKFNQTLGVTQWR